MPLGLKIPFFDSILGKIVMIGGAIALLLLILRWYGNSKYAEGERNKQVEVSREVLKTEKETREKVEAEWEAKQPELAKIAGELDRKDLATKNDIRLAILSFQERKAKIKDDVAAIPSGKVRDQMLAAMRDLRQ